MSLTKYKNRNKLIVTNALLVNTDNNGNRKKIMNEI